MRKMILIPLLMLGAATLSGVALADGGFHGHHHRGAQYMHMLHQLSLTDAQKTSIHTIMQNHQADFKAGMASERQVHQSLAALDTGDSNYNANVETLAQQEATNAADRVRHMAQVKAEVYAVLTEPQKTQLNALIQKAQAEHAAHAWGNHQNAVAPAATPAQQ